MAAALAFSAGIAIASYTWRPPVAWLFCFLFAALGALLLSRRTPRLAYATALLSFALLGAITLSGRDSMPPADSSILNFADGSEVQLTGYVARDGILRPSSFGGNEQSIDFHIQSITSGGLAQPLSGTARLTLYIRHRSRPAELDDDSSDSPPRSEAMPLYHYGQLLRLTAKLHRPLNYQNPGAFDYRGWLRSQGIVAVGSAPAETIQVLPGSDGSSLAARRSRVRRSIIQRIHSTWPGQHAALIDAMLIGERAFINRDLRQAFQRSGTYHILVVSGMNVGILAFVVFFVLRRLRFGSGLATAFTLLLAAGYVFVADAGAPIVRATLMLAVYLLTRLFFRDHAALNAVGLAALTILVADPRSILEPSFQLTFLSVLAIAGIGLPLVERTSEPFRHGLRLLHTVGFDRALPPRITQFRLDLRLVTTRLSWFFGLRIATALVVGTCRAIIGAYELLLISALMQVALALPMAWYFHRATALALPANMLVVPFTGLLMPASVLAVALSYLSTTLARVPAAIAGISLDLITGTVRLVGSIRVADVRVPVPSPWFVIGAAITLALALLLARRHRLLSALGIATLVCSALLMAAWSGPAQVAPGTLEITAIDVGQGDSLLIITPQGKTLLLDSGGHIGNGSEFDVGEDVVSPYLWRRGIRRLDVVAISHGHSDHMGGMRAIVRNFQPRELWMGKSVSTPLLEELRKDCQSDGVAWVERVAGERFEFGGAQFQVLAPASGWDLKSQVRDDDAMVLRISYGANSILLPGDAGKKIEQRLATELPPSDVLKVAHHRSVTSTTPELLAAARPSYAIISVGARNTFRHPRPEVLARLQAADTRTYRTDMMGAVSFHMDGRSIRVTTALR